MTLPSITAPRAPVPVHVYVRRLGVRLWLQQVLRALPLALGVACAILLGASLFSGPVLTTTGASISWLCVIAAFGVTLALQLRALAPFRGSGIARLLEAQDRSLSSRVRSALELSATSEMPGQSPELLSAHVAQVERRLAELPEAQVLPWSRLSHATSAVGLSLLALCALLVATDARFGAFVGALLSPAPVREDGTRVSSVVRQLRVKLTYPSYLGHEPTTLVDPIKITAPRGTNMELQVEPRFPAERGFVYLGPRASNLDAAAGGAFVTRLALRESASLRIQLESGGVRYEDGTARTLQVVVDRTPQVTIESPASSTVVEPNDVLSLRFFASDDAGLASVDMHARLPSGEVKQRRLWSALDDGGARTELRASSAFAIAELPVQEGDVVVLWLEAHDGDLVSGPNTGKSAEVSIEVASPGKRLASFIPALQAAADAAVALLGDRLESDVPADADPARQRFAKLERASGAWLAQIDEVVRLAEHAKDGRGLDTDQLHGVRKRNKRLLDGEAALHTASVAPIALRQNANERSVGELERDVILLADLLAKAHVDEAGAIADELRDLKKRIEELMSKLDKSSSPEDERKLLAEIAQAERRLAELSQSLQRMATRVPSEFVNREALKAPESETTLAELENAVRKHDLKSAAKHLDDLAKQIDELASQIGEGGMKLRESRFGPRDQAMAGARQNLDMLREEQERLAGRSESVMQGTQPGGKSGDDGAAQGLAPRADALRKELDQLGTPGPGHEWQSQALDRAGSRLDDTREALENGDLSAANGTAQNAAQDLEQAANELENEARMYPGPNGEASRKAEAARKAANDARDLANEIAKNAQEGSAGLSPAERQRLQQDVEPQRKTRDATSQLRDTMEKGVDGTPLSPDGVESLENAQQAMQRAEQALQRGDAKGASAAQREASTKLAKLAEKLAQEQKPQHGRGSPSDSQEAESGDDLENAPVHIPGADEFKAPAQMRRKLLDAMREASPSGYEAAIQRYYQELLR